jgi:hypothetical protein
MRGAKKSRAASTPRDLFWVEDAIWGIWNESAADRLVGFRVRSCRGGFAEETYFAARNRYIATFKKLEVSAQAGDALSKQEKQALSDLEQQLRGIIGNIAIRGFSIAATPCRFRNLDSSVPMM